MFPSKSTNTTGLKRFFCNCIQINFVSFKTSLCYLSNRRSWAGGSLRQEILGGAQASLGRPPKSLSFCLVGVVCAIIRFVASFIFSFSRDVPLRQHFNEGFQFVQISHAFSRHFIQFNLLKTQ